MVNPEKRIGRLEFEASGGVGTGRRGGLKSRCPSGACGFDSTRRMSIDSERDEARRCAHRRGRLPRPERGHPGGRAAVASPRVRRHRGRRRLARPRRERPRAADRARGLGDPAARRDDHRHLADEPVQDRWRRRRACCATSRGRARRAGRHRRRGHAGRRREAVRRARSCPSSASRRRSTTTCPATDYTFGFDTAVSIATEAIDRLHTTAESHDRVMVVEVMGRHTGWIAVMSGIAGGADVILIPELPDHASSTPAPRSRKRHERGKSFSIVVVSEGYKLTFDSGEERQVTQEAELDQFGHVRLGGVGEQLAARDRAAHRLRDPRHRPRPRAARRHRRRRATACWRRATASRPPTWCTRGTSAGWRRSTATRSSMSRSPRRPPSEDGAVGVVLRGPARFSARRAAATRSERRACAPRWRRRRSRTGSAPRAPRRTGERRRCRGRPKIRNPPAAPPARSERAPSRSRAVARPAQRRRRNPSASRTAKPSTLPSSSNTQAPSPASTLPAKYAPTSS